MEHIWGQLVSIDLHDCNHDRLRDQAFAASFLARLVHEIDMVPHGEPIVDRFGDDELEGVSGIQFLKTSSITIHFDEVRNRAFIDVFSCKPFDAQKAIDFSTRELGGTLHQQATMMRS